MPPADMNVVCAWPLSGQYGTGSRFSYYVLLGIVIFLRRIRILQDAALTAALLFPAVAAIHGVVLAAVHKDGMLISNFVIPLASTYVCACAKQVPWTSTPLAPSSCVQLVR